jgi:dTDP-4-dehydrorhamnose 3,5-epimerase
MNIVPVEEVQHAFVVEMDCYRDHRGWFQEVANEAASHGLQYATKQVNVSSSRKHVVRGLHVAPFAKFCTCVRGKLFDVVADVRRHSPTYGQWYGIWLSESNHKQLYVPAGCAHGFFSAEDNTLLLYLQDGTYNPGVEREVNWQDPVLNIHWPAASEYILSDKDKDAPFLEE